MRLSFLTFIICKKSIYLNYPNQIKVKKNDLNNLPQMLR